MGQLIHIDSIPNADWYFEDAHWLGSSMYEGWKYTWPSPQFPIMLGIHSDNFTNPLKIEIRRWIEITLAETVLIDKIDKSYRMYYGTDWERVDRFSSYDSRYRDVSNRWYRFHFENEESAVAFKLRFGEYIQPITDKHPTEEKT